MDDELLSIPQELHKKNRYVKAIRENEPAYTFPLYEVEDISTSCGTCTKVCPTKAIQFATIKEPIPNAHYRNSNISLSELIESNQQR